VCVITSAFELAARARARTLAMQDHPIVVMKHPLATRSEAEVRRFAEALVGEIVSGLTLPP
jgi:hypothetical protein